MTCSLITGASTGIGAAFASALAERGHDLVIVARNQEQLEANAAQLRQNHGVSVEVLVADLSVREQVSRIAARLGDPERPVDVLVNNAGFGVPGGFVAGELRAQEQMLDVMVRSVMVLSHAAAGAMVRRGQGSLITVSSIAGFMAGGTYSAAKAWATSFTTSLHAELAGTGVTATALCPGYVHTTFHSRLGISDNQAAPRWAWLDADALVTQCLQDVAAGKSLSIPSIRYRAAYLALRYVPGIAEIAGRMRAGSR